MEIIIVLTAAVIIDLIAGDPPNSFHPVAWMGKVITLMEKTGLKLKPAGQLLYGIFITLFATALFSIPAYYLLTYLHGLNIIAFFLISALLLKSTFSIRGMWQAARKIKNLLREKEMEKARFELRALVSRKTAELPEPLIVSAAVESVAEGTVDSLVSPLFYFLFLGVPGAVAYRVVNTLDAMIGYHGKYEYLGKFSARLDDTLNYIPARLATLFLVLAAFFTRNNGKSAWRTALSEHVKTESPNAGWPMAAMSGALQVQLEKPGYYILGKSSSTLVQDTIERALSLFSMAVLIWVLVCLIAGGIYFAVTA